MQSHLKQAAQNGNLPTLSVDPNSVELEIEEKGKLSILNDNTNINETYPSMGLACG